MKFLEMQFRVGVVHGPDGSYLTWRRGTGENVEITNLKAAEPGHGVGTALLRGLLEQLLADPPYHTVYGFTRTTNEAAQAFYSASGFALSWVHGVYRDGAAVVFSAPYHELCALHKVTRVEDAP